MKILFFLLLSFTAFSQSTTTITSIHTTNEVLDIILPSNMKSTFLWSKSSRIVATVVVTADIPLHLLEFITKDVVTKVSVDNGVYSISVDKLPTKIYKGKEIVFTYHMELTLPVEGRLASK